jgi:hypothetical protein
MAKAHEGLTPTNLPDATSAAVPASALEPSDPIAGLVAGGAQPDGTVAPADGTAPPLDLTGQQPQQAPAGQPRRSPKTIGDLLTGHFGGG